MMFAPLSVGLWILAGEPSLASPYAEHVLVEVDVPDRAALRDLLATGVDPWMEHPRPGVVPALVSPAQWSALAAGGWSLRVIDGDVQAAVDAERERLAARPPHVPGAGGFFDDFQQFGAIEAELAALADAAPDLVELDSIGESIQGRTIHVVTLTTAGPDAPAVIVTSGQHAREWIAISSGMYLVEEIVARADEPEYAAMLSTIKVIVVPVVNPDGYEYSWFGQRYWRKNRRDGVGVDTNRNFGRSWGGEGASNVPMDENYAGTAAFSEPESAAVRDLVLAHPEAVAHLDVHSFGQLVLYPWGDVYQLAPDDAELSATALAMEAAMEVGGADYLPLQGVNLYPASGNAIDWTYEAGLHALTVELRPQDPEVGFVLPPDQIVPVGEDVLAAAWVLFDRAMGDVPDPTGEDTGSGVDTTGTDPTGATTGDVADTTGGGATSSSPTTTTTSSTTAAGESSEEGTSGAGADTNDEGCGCGGSRLPSGPGGALVVLGLAAARARRHARRAKLEKSSSSR